jgi:hypothetical protein
MGDGPDDAIGKLTFVNRIVTPGALAFARAGLGIGGWRLAKTGWLWPYLIGLAVLYGIR